MSTGTGAARYFHAILYQLRQKPVLTAMMVCLLVFGLTALTASIALWRVNSTCTVTENRSLPNVALAQAATDLPDRSDPLVQQSFLQFESGIRVAQIQSSSALSHRGVQASCPCARMGSPARAIWRRI